MKIKTYAFSILALSLASCGAPTTNDRSTEVATTDSSAADLSVNVTQVASSISSDDVQALKLHSNCYFAQNLLLQYRADWLDDTQRVEIENSKASHKATADAIIAKYESAINNGNTGIAIQLKQATQDMMDRYEAELKGKTEAGRSELGNQIAGQAKDEIASYGQSAECST